MRHDKAVTEHQKGGHDKKAAPHAQTARGHSAQATEHASAAAKFHASHDGQQEDFWAKAQVRERFGVR
jgi:hypothetical protein